MRCVSGVITAGAGRTEASEHPDGEGRCCGTDVLLLLLGRPRYVRATIHTLTPASDSLRVKELLPQYRSMTFCLKHSAGK